MSLDLEAQIKSLKVTDETLLALRVEGDFTGKTHAQIAREVLHEWAVRDREAVAHKSRLYKAWGPREGAGGEPSGTVRKATRIALKAAVPGDITPNTSGDL